MSAGLRTNERRDDANATRGDTLAVVLEAPHRIAETAAEMLAVFGPRPAVFARELTKLHEEFIRGRLDEIHAALSERATSKGEFTILVARAEAPPANTSESAADAVRRLEAEGVPRMDAMKRVARERGVSKRDVYKEMESD